MPELNFKGKEFVFNHHLTVPFRPLEIVTDKSVGAPVLDGNLIIHGDNLHALKALLPSHAGSVDCIFIDPPYNTGNEGWRYNDNVNSPMIREWLNDNPIGLVDELRKVLSRWREKQAAAVFRERLDDGQIEFRVRGDAGDWTAPDHVWTTAAQASPQVLSGTGGALERSLFLPVYASDLNDDEKQVAVYLDAQAVIKWWHRNGTDRGSYALRGWRRGNVYPDFIFAALRVQSGERIVAVESKGDQLAGNLDTEYKRELLETLSKAFGKAAASKSGELPIPAQDIDYEAAVVLFSDWRTKLPVLITG